MWKRLSELNKAFRDIKKFKKYSKTLYLRCNFFFKIVTLL